MAGDYSAVPLRADDRWNAARMQQGRVLLDHEWNLDVDAAARARQHAAVDAIGPAGVAAGSSAFAVEVVPAQVAASGEPVPAALRIGAGRMWVGGLEAHAPAPFLLGDQDGMEAHSTIGRSIVYLDVHAEDVQPAEHPDLIDPALAPLDTATRGRVGYRVRQIGCPLVMVSTDDVRRGMAHWAFSSEMSIWLQPAPDQRPCDPPAVLSTLVPDGLLRVEVLDSGAPLEARIVWSYEGGAAAVAVAGISGATVTLALSASVHFVPGDLVEVSWSARRADDKQHGPLYVVKAVAGGPGGDLVTLDRQPPTSAAGRDGLVLRRWDGEVRGGDGTRTVFEGYPVTLRGLDVGVWLRVGLSSWLRAGDWWGARLRAGSAAGTAGAVPTVEAVEERHDAPPDGSAHFFAPLAIVDFDEGIVECDCRATFPSVVGLTVASPPVDACTVAAGPGDDLEALVRRLPATGGRLCLAAGTYELARPLRIFGRDRLVISGAGAATMLRATGAPAAIILDRCRHVAVRDLWLEGGPPTPPDPGSDQSRMRVGGALTLLGCADVEVTGCTLRCRGDADREVVTGLRASDDVNGGSCGTVTVRACRFIVGPSQVGMWLDRVGWWTDPYGTGRDLAGGAYVVRNQFEMDGAIANLGVMVQGATGAVDVIENHFEGVTVGVSVSADYDKSDVRVSGNVVRALRPLPGDGRAILVVGGRSVLVSDTVASLEPPAFWKSSPGIEVAGAVGPFVVVRHSSLSGFDLGVRFHPTPPFTPRATERVWSVTETIAIGVVARPSKGAEVIAGTYQNRNYPA